MRRVLLLGIALLLLVGCKKATQPSAAPPPGAGTTGTTTGTGGGDSPPAVHAPTGVVVHPGTGGGGSGGAVQAVRKAVTRTVNRHDLVNLRLFIDTAAQTNGQMPTAQEISQSLQIEAPRISQQIRDGAIVLTGTRSRSNIWAYTWEPQNAAGEHLILTASGVEQLTTPLLRQRLMQQQGQ